MIKRYSILFAALLLFPVVSPAQEFRVNMKLQESGGGSRTGAFGFDAAATDGYDQQFGENPVWPPPFETDFRFVGTATGQNINDGDGDPVNIRKKPSTDAFTLKYQWSLNAVKFPVTLSWNQITNANVKAILMSPTAAPNFVLGDMTKVSSINIPDNTELQKYREVILTVYYNIDPTASVKSIRAGELISELSAWPNPANAKSTLGFMLSKPSQVTVTAVDIAGREIYNNVLQGVTGENKISLVGINSLATGPISIRVIASDNGTLVTRSIHLLHQK